jgi:predicted RNA-binding protein YlxR (DUF448 family)
LRRCLASGERRPKERLLRFVVGPEGQLAPDLREKLPGRGLWIVPRRDMIAAAERKKLFARAAKAPVQVPEDLAERVDALLARQCLDLISLARKAGEAVAGHDKVRGWLESGRVALLLEASDASEAGSRRMIGFAKALGDRLEVAQLFTAAQLGGAFGRDQAVHVAVAPGGLADKLSHDVVRLKEYRSEAPPRTRRQTGRQTGKRKPGAR